MSFHRKMLSTPEGRVVEVASAGDPSGPTVVVHHGSPGTAGILDVFAAAAARDLHLALLRVPDSLAAAWWPALSNNAETVTALRSCLMKPEHESWLPEIVRRLDTAAAAATGA